MTMFTTHEETTLLAYATDQKEVASLAWLHGFLFCVAILPENLKSNEWISGGIAEKVLSKYSQKDAELLERCLFGVYNRLVKQNQDNELQFPFVCDPAMLDEIARIRLWTQGFSVAIKFCPELWGMGGGDVEINKFVSQLFEDKDSYDRGDIAWCLTVVMGVAFPETIAEFFANNQNNPEGTNLNDLDYEANLLTQLPESVEVLQWHAYAVGEKMGKHLADTRSAPPKSHQLLKIGRNDQCPCGSGAKYKKCCGK